MRKTLFLQLMMAMAVGTAQAQSEGTYYDFQDVQFTVETKDGSLQEQLSVAGVVNHVSSNGDYAVGYDDQSITSNTGVAFLWKRSNPDELVPLSGTYDRVSACDVSDDGVIVGSFELRPNSYDYGISFPGWKHVDDDAWTPLPVPDEYSIRFAKTYDFAEEARAITPDGGTIAGNLHFRSGEQEILGTIVDKTIVPITVWVKKEDGYELQKCYTDLGKAGNNLLYDVDEQKFVETKKDVNYKSFLVRDISDDGKTVVGMNVSWRGGFNPAFMRDGKLYQIFSCGEEGEPDEDANFNGGTILTIDANGNMYGYYMDGEGDTKYFVFTFNEETVKLEYVNEPVVCADKDGNRFGAYDKGLSPVSDCSKDGKVIVGAGVGDLGFGQYNYPKLVIAGEASGISEVQAGQAGDKAGVGINFDGNTIRVKGDWLYANVYTASGTLVDGGNRGSSFNIGRYPAGTYIVKVATMNGIQSFKVAK